MASARPGFCRVCKIGTLDAEGRCVLCGAPSVPLSPPRRAVGTLLAALTSAPVLALGAVLVTGAGLVGVLNYLGPDRAPALLRTGPMGGLSTGALAALLLAPVLLGLVVILILFLLGRRGGRPGRARNAA